MAADNDIARNVPPATNTADKTITWTWLYVDKQSKVVRHRGVTRPGKVHTQVLKTLS